MEIHHGTRFTSLTEHVGRSHARSLVSEYHVLFGYLPPPKPPLKDESPIAPPRPVLDQAKLRELSTDKDGPEKASLRRFPSLS